MTKRRKKTRKKGIIEGRNEKYNKQWEWMKEERKQKIDEKENN